MKFFRISSKNDQWLLVNFGAVIFVEFNDERNEIIFDGILRIEVEDEWYENFRKEIFKRMVNLK